MWIWAFCWAVTWFFMRRASCILALWLRGARKVEASEWCGNLARLRLHGSLERSDSRASWLSPLAKVGHSCSCLLSASCFMTATPKVRLIVKLPQQRPSQGLVTASQSLVSLPWTQERDRRLWALVASYPSTPDCTACDIFVLFKFRGDFIAAQMHATPEECYDRSSLLFQLRLEEIEKRREVRMSSICLFLTSAPRFATKIITHTERWDHSWYCRTQLDICFSFQQQVRLNFDWVLIGKELGLSPTDARQRFYQVEGTSPTSSQPTSLSSSLGAPTLAIPLSSRGIVQRCCIVFSISGLSCRPLTPQMPNEVPDFPLGERRRSRTPLVDSGELTDDSLTKFILLYYGFSHTFRSELADAFIAHEGLSSSFHWHLLSLGIAQQYKMLAW